MADLIGTCDVWWRQVETIDEEDLAVLDKGEQTRLAAYRRYGDRARFAAAAALLRRSVGDCVGAPPESVVVDRTCTTCGGRHGRPRLPGIDLHASVTHSGNRCAVALTAVGPVGIDIEHVQPVDAEALSTFVLAADEQASSLKDFYRYWTRKESVVKATGDGLQVALTALRVSNPVEVPRLLHYPGRPELAAIMRDLDVGDDYAGAVTILTSSAVHIRSREVRR